MRGRIASPSGAHCSNRRHRVSPPLRHRAGLQDLRAFLRDATLLLLGLQVKLRLGILRAKFAFREDIGDVPLLRLGEERLQVLRGQLHLHPLFGEAYQAVCLRAHHHGCSAECHHHGRLDTVALHDDVDTDGGEREVREGQGDGVHVELEEVAAGLLPLADQGLPPRGRDQPGPGAARAREVLLGFGRFQVRSHDHLRLCLEVLLGVPIALDHKLQLPHILPGST
mmetsp:Transcript_107548/g.286181  ORF Transcript_107548/g.286181 Transcript_107548/m.286181 type:complete len:225 (+) Transcript_107548:142-816(+)